MNELLMAVTLSPLEAGWMVLARDHMPPMILGMARIGACFAWIPYLSPGVMSARMVRSLVALMVVIGLWPSLQLQPLPQDLPGLAIAALGEALVGTAIGLVVALPFHIFHGLGAIVDYQRGASIGAILDPISGVEATETAYLVQMMSVMVFLASGGLTYLLEVIQASYALVPLGAAPNLQLDMLQVHAGRILAGAVRMAAPVLLLLFLAELLLGLMSRFAQQMNAFSVSLAVKSLLAFLALLIYLLPTVIGQVPSIRDSLDPLQLLERAPQ